MRQDFPSSMLVSDQLLRLSAGKTPGRKHQKRAGPSKKANKLAAFSRGKTQWAQSRKSKNSRNVAAYFRGEIDFLPRQIK